MSDRSLALRLVVEGETDAIMLESFIVEILGTERISFTTIQPEFSMAFGNVSLGPHGGGWKGVRGKCQELASADLEGMLENTDALIVHLDGEVALDKQACNSPPARKAADIVAALTATVHGWLATPSGHPRLVIAVPCMETEAWLLPTLHPGKVAPAKVETVNKPSHYFSAKKLKLVELSGKKRTGEYRKSRDVFRKAWSGAAGLVAAQAFARGLRAAVG